MIIDVIISFIINHHY